MCSSIWHYMSKMQRKIGKRDGGYMVVIWDEVQFSNEQRLTMATKEMAIETKKIRNNGVRDVDCGCALPSWVARLDLYWVALVGFSCSNTVQCQHVKKRQTGMFQIFQGSCDPENHDCNCVDSSFADCTESQAENKVVNLFLHPFGKFTQSWYSFSFKSRCMWTLLKNASFNVIFSTPSKVWMKQCI